MWLVPTAQSERTPASTYPRVAGVFFLGSDEQIFGVDEQVPDGVLSDQGVFGLGCGRDNASCHSPGQDADEAE